MAPGQVLRRQGSAVAWCGRGLVALGPPGAGKSALVMGLLGAGGWLVADDVVTLERVGATVLAAPVTPAGLIELRGNGIFRLATTSWVPVHLCVELASAGPDDRLPERRTTMIAGVEVPLLRLPAGHPSPVAATLIALVARRAA